MFEYEYSQVIEQAFLGSLFYDPLILNETKVKEKDLYNSKNKIIFRIINKLKEYNLEITPIIFNDFIQKKKTGLQISDCLEVIDNCENSLYWKSYEKCILEHSKEQKLNNVKNKLNKNNIQESIKEINEIVKEEEGGNNVMKLIDSVNDLLETYKKRNNMLGYKGPFPILDNYIGGIIEGKIYTILAYSNVGKSSFSYNFVVNALKQGKKVKIFSLEEQKDRVFLNICKCFYKKSIKDFSEDFFIEIKKFKDLIIFDDIYKLDDIINNIGEDEIVFIDFIQMIKANGTSEYENMTEVAQELQRIGKINKTTIFCISQVNNENKNKGPAYMLPKGSGALFSNSDVILGLYRKEKYLFLSLIKNKFGPKEVDFFIDVNFSILDFKLVKEVGQEDFKTDFNF